MNIAVLDWILMAIGAVLFSYGPRLSHFLFSEEYFDTMLLGALLLSVGAVDYIFSFKKLFSKIKIQKWMVNKAGYFFVGGILLFLLGSAADYFFGWCPEGHTVAKIGMILFAIGLISHILTKK